MTTASKKGISQAKLIEGIYDCSHFNRMCNGKENINLEVLILCASKLGIPIDRLFYLEKSGNDVVEEIKELYQEYMLVQQYDDLASLLIRLQSLEKKNWYTNQIEYNIQGVLQAQVYKHYDKAYDYFKSALLCTCKIKQYEDIDFTYLNEDELNICNNIAMCSYYLQSKDYILYYTKLISALLQNKKKSSHMLLPKFCYNFSMLLIRQENYDEGISYAQKGLEVSLASKNFLFLGHLYYNLALAYRHSNEELMRHYLEKAKASFFLENRFHIFQQVYSEDFEEPTDHKKT